MFVCIKFGMQSSVIQLTCIIRYKDALKALAEKEKRLEDLCQKKSSQLDRLAFENK